jgi:hypothetical protein
MRHTPLSQKPPLLPMRGWLRQSSSVLQLIVQMVGLSMTVRGSGETAVQVNSVGHCPNGVQGSPNSIG